jgi:ketosteroid isomerase-like protein
MPVLSIRNPFGFRLIAAWMTAIFLAMLAATSAPPAQAQANPDQGAIRGVISDQLDAFLADDAARAYSHASPGIRQLFPGEERFMGMVRRGYAPVYRSRSREFLDLRQTPLGPEQEVLLIDANGQEWLALYTMEQQPDGSWKIAGVRLVRQEGVAA